MRRPSHRLIFYREDLEWIDMALARLAKGCRARMAFLSHETGHVVASHGITMEEAADLLKSKSPGLHLSRLNAGFHLAVEGGLRAKSVVARVDAAAERFCDFLEEIGARKEESERISREFGGPSWPGSPLPA